MTVSRPILTLFDEPQPAPKLSPEQEGLAQLCGTYRSTSDKCLYRVELCKEGLQQSRCCDCRQGGPPDTEFGTAYKVEEADVKRLIAFKIFQPVA